MSDIKQMPVQILGKEYVVACKSDEVDELAQSARFLDRRMRDIRETGKVIGTERIAVMAALNLAHELLHRGPANTVAPATSSTEEQEAINARLRQLQEKIDLALGADERLL